MPQEANEACHELNYRRVRGIVLYDGFYVLKESLTQCNRQLSAIAALDTVQKQFIGTLVDTEVAVGYFLVREKQSKRRWTAYVAVKMKYGGDVAYFASLIGSRSPSRTYNTNTLTGSKDLRWSKQVEGLVAYALLREVRPFLHNEKSIIEVDCILKHGPGVSAERPHPFTDCGAAWVRRGVWYWPQIDEERTQQSMPTADK